MRSMCVRISNKVTARAPKHRPDTYQRYLQPRQKALANSSRHIHSALQVGPLPNCRVRPRLCENSVEHGRTRNDVLPQGQLQDRVPTPATTYQPLRKLFSADSRNWSFHTASALSSRSNLASGMTVIGQGYQLQAERGLDEWKREGGLPSNLLLWMPLGLQGISEP